MKLISWNVNGLRAVVKKGFFETLEKENPDIMCIQETKAQDHQVMEVLEKLEGYEVYVNSAERPGYSGTTILTRVPVIEAVMGIGSPEHDREGRVICLEFKDFFLVNVYVPNSGNDLKRLDYRQQWDKDFFDFLKQKEQRKPVIICGDFNVAHREIDLARPKANYNKSAGYMQQEIDGMDRYTGGGFSDSFRYFYPDRTDIYSWWSYRAGARQKNVGWRIDYFLLSKSLLSNAKDACILTDIMGSDHCPVGIDMDFE